LDFTGVDFNSAPFISADRKLHSFYKKSL